MAQPPPLSQPGMAHEVTAPVLHLHSREDDPIPFHMAEALAKQTKGRLNSLKGPTI